MTTPQPQPMKRYRIHNGEPTPDPCGVLIRFDDPAIAAAVTAMEAAREWFSKMYGDDDELTERLRLALANLTKGTA